MSTQVRALYEKYRPVILMVGVILLCTASILALSFVVLRSDAADPNAEAATVQHDFLVAPDGHSIHRYIDHEMGVVCYKNAGCVPLYNSEVPYGTQEVPTHPR